jgi:hypothetical protein
MFFPGEKLDKEFGQWREQVRGLHDLLFNGYLDVMIRTAAFGEDLEEAHTALTVATDMVAKLMQQNTAAAAKAKKARADKRLRREADRILDEVVHPTAAQKRLRRKADRIFDEVRKASV